MLHGFFFVKMKLNHTSFSYYTFLNFQSFSSISKNSKTNVIFWTKIILCYYYIYMYILVCIFFCLFFVIFFTFIFSYTYVFCIQPYRYFIYIYVYMLYYYLMSQLILSHIQQICSRQYSWLKLEKSMLIKLYD